MSRLLATFWILSHFSLVAAIIWAGALAFPIATTIWIFWGRDGYRRAVFRVETLHYSTGADAEAGGPSYWAMGWVAPGNRFERLSLHRFFEKPPTCLADIEQVLHKGDALAVLYNPELTDMMVQCETPRLLLDKGDIWSEMRSELKRELLWALTPLGIGSIMVYLARRWSKSGPLILVRYRRRGT